MNELNELMDNRMHHFTSKEDKLKERIEELLSRNAKLESDYANLRQELEELKKSNQKEHYEARICAILDEHKDYVREVQKENNQHLTEVITNYEKKLSHLNQLHKQEKKELESEKLRIDERVKFREQAEVAIMREEIAELRKELQDCEKNLFKAMNTLKENKAVIAKLKDSNAELQAELSRTKAAQATVNQREKETLNKIDIGLDFGTWDIEQPIFPKPGAESRLEGSAQVTLEDPTENPFQIIVKHSGEFAERRTLNHKIKSTTPVRPDNFQSSVYSKNTALLMEEDSALRFSRSRDTDRRETSTKDESRGKKVSFFDADKENIPASETVNKSLKASISGLTKEKKFEGRHLLPEPSLRKDGSLLRMDVSEKFPSGDKFRAASRTSSFLDKQKPADRHQPARNLSSVELQVSDLLKKLGTRQPELRIRDSRYDPFQPLRTREGSMDTRKKRDGLSDRGFLNFYRENNKTSSFILEEELQ